MKRSMRFLTAAVLAVAFAASLAAAEYVKNGDFESGNVAPWRLSKPNAEVTLAIVPDSGSPCGGSGALGITLPGVKRVDVTQRVKIGPGTYKLTAYMDTTRCTKQGGYIMLYLSGTVDGKWHNFGTVATPGTRKGVGWRKTEWQKYEKIVTVPEGGVIKSVNISFISLTGTVMLDDISVQECAPDAQATAQDEKKK